MSKFSLFLSIIFLLLNTSTYNALAQENDFSTENIGIMAYDMSDEELIDLLKEKLRSDSLSTRSWLMLGGLWENRMQYDSAVAAYQRAIAVDSTCTKCKQHLASSLANLGKNGWALRIYQEILETDSSNVSVRSQFARLLRRDGRFLEAFLQFEHLLQVDTLNSYLWEQLGDCAMRIDSMAVGLHAYNKSFELNPANMPLAIKLINGFIKGGIPPGIVMPIADIAYKQDSTYVPIIRTKGYLFYLSQVYPDAEKWLEKASIMGDSSRFTHKFLGISKYHIGKYLAATEYLEKAFEKDTSDNVLNYIMANSYIQIGDWPRAIELLDMTEELLTPNPKEIALLYASRGEAYKKANQFQKAIAQFEKALELHPDYKAYIYEIGLCYYNAKDYDNAKKTLEDFLVFADDSTAMRSITERAPMAKHFIRRINGETFFIDDTNVKIKESSE
ncbi:MAG: tetratricopeptide repeat protein [Tenuifilaceae bacterium]|nr:tetratricopeptide repeat protein [Tenuifilaceae bacterium]